jgi:3-phenylpropionate/trans-cinnamate dioxygenase ferredoxin subunit
MDSREYDVGAVDDFRPGEVRRKSIGKRGIAIVRRDDNFYALRDLCPHQGAQLSTGTLSGTPRPCLPGEDIVLDRIGKILICPWHGWEFDVANGRSTDSPCSGRVRTYPVRVCEGRVMVNVG